jgi:flagellar protein FlbD
LNSRPFVLNCDLIKFIEETPDTMITLINNEKILVVETAEEIIEKVIEFGRRKRIFKMD